jgi:GNAT superfamily N-acetyltransferase
MDRGQVSVAAWSEDPETIIGWCCVEVGVLHYAFVRKEFRRTGIARLLLDSMLTDDVLVTHRTTDADRIRWPAGWRYNVYAGLR